jgi:hypothetical protein
MSSIQPPLLSRKTLVEPALYMGLALLAGSTRLIEVFPGTTLGGLLLGAGLASTSSLIYNRTLHDDSHHYFRTLLGKATLVACATLCTTLLAKSLKDRASISPLAAARLGALQVAIAVVTTFLNQESELERKHRLYSTTEQKAWRRLELEERSELAKAFYDAGLPALSLFEAPIDPRDRFDTLEEVMINLNRYSKEELSWYREFTEFHETETFFRFATRCVELGLSPPLLEHCHGYIEDCIEENPGYKASLYQWFQNDPLLYLSNHLDVARLFPDKPPLPSYEEVLKTLDASTIPALPPEKLNAWYLWFRDRGGWDAQSEPVRTAFVQRFVEFDTMRPDRQFITLPGDLTWFRIWFKNLTDETLSEPPSKSMQAWCVALLPTLDPQPEIPTEKALALFAKYQIALPLELTSELVALATDPTSEKGARVLAHLQKQYKHRDYENDYGFSKLSFAEQKALNAAFGHKADRLPGYTLTAEVVAEAQRDKELLRSLKGQFGYYASHNDYGFSKLSFADQKTLKGLFGDESRYLPGYTLTAEVVAEAQQEEGLLTSLKQQFQGYGEKDYGFSSLSFADQKALKVLFRDDAGRLPKYHLTDDAVVAAATDPELLAALIEQFTQRYGRNRDYGFSELSAQNQVKLKELFGEKAGSLPPYTLSHALIELAQEDVEIVASLKTQFGNRYERREDFGYSDLDFADKKALKRLFVLEQNLLPPYPLSHDLIVAAQGDEELIASLNAQFAYRDREDCGYSQLTLDDQILLKTLLDADAQRNLPPFLLTVALIEKAQGCPPLVTCLKVQFTPDRHRFQEDFGFLALPEVTQQTLRALFDDEEELLPLRITSAIAQEVQRNVSLVKRLKKQFAQGGGNDFGFFALNPIEQATFRSCFAKNKLDWDDHFRDYHIPYPITHELIEEQERNFILKNHLIGQFQHRNPQFDFGFYALDLPTQERLRTLFGEDASIPYRFTHALLIAAQANPKLKEALKEQLGHYRNADNDSFTQLSLQDRLAFIALYKDDEYPPHFPPFQLTAAVVTLAERNPDLVNLLKEQFGGWGREETYGFQELSKERRTKLRELFGGDAYLPPEEV